MRDNNNLIWLDLEMTGLRPEQDFIIEIATIVTDANLNILAEGPVLAINQPLAIMTSMDEWNTKQHNSSGLVTRVLQSTVTEADAERQTLEFLGAFIDKKQSPMCGNSICQDRRFLYKYMPELEAFFHYRNLDVSTLKELAKRWRPDLNAKLSKESKHLALEDIKDSIAEMLYYRQHFIQLQVSP